jgi:putative heme-binding domain-containing protein
MFILNSNKKDLSHHSFIHFFLYPRTTFYSLYFGLYLSQLTLGAFAADAGNLYNTIFDVRAGEKYFDRQCSRCHGIDAKGDDEIGAPDLTGRLRRANTTAGIFNVLRNGVPGTAMIALNPEVPDSLAWQLVAYIESLASDPANINLPGSPTRGRKLYSGITDCAGCHMIEGLGGRNGPDLTLIGERLRPEQINSALLRPNEKVTPRWWTVSVRDQNGNFYQGLRMSEDSFSLRIMDVNEELYSFSKNRLEEWNIDKSSTMPSYQGKFTDSELEDLVAFLFSLRSKRSL